MLTLVMCAALSQVPQKVGVVHSSNLGVSAKRVAEITQQLLDLLAAQKIEAVESKLPCDDRPCLVQFAREAGAPAVVAVSFAPLGKDTIVSLDGLATDGRQLAQRSFTVKGADAPLPAEASAFVAAMKTELATAPPKPVEKEVVVKDAPKETKLVPPAEEPPPELVVERPEHSRAPAIGVAVGAVAVGVAAVILLALASSDAQEANRQTAPGVAAHPRMEAEGLASSANAKYTGSLVAGIGAGALAVTSMVLFTY